MRRLWVGMLLASLPFALLAQNLDRRPAREDPVTAVPMPPDNQPTPTTPDEQPYPETPDNAVTISPLPPPDQDTPADNQQLVPNPLDNPGTPAAPGTKQAQPQGQPVRGAWVQMGTATLQALDKVNARAGTLVVKVGDTGHFGSLDISVRGCFVRSADRPADATAYLIIRDQRAEAPAFTGWMVRSAPYMSMLAHPIYDIRVTGCS
jgi:hypothetical protein